MSINLPMYHCLRCHHTWVPRKLELPKQCPRVGCGTKLWNKDYEREHHITEDVISRMRNCKFTLCQKRYEKWASYLGIVKTKPKPKVKERRRQITTKVVTQGTLPEGFKRIKTNIE